MSERRGNKRRLDDAERVLPHNLEAERSVLGAALLHEDVLDAVRPLEGAHFYREAHRYCFEAMQRLHDRRVAIDFTTIRDELDRVEKLEEVGGPAYIASLVDGVPRSTNAAHYAAIVMEKAKLRALVFIGNKVASDAYIAEDTAEQIIAAADAELITLGRTGSRSAMQHLKSNVANLLDVVEYRVAHRGQVTGVPTGFASIDGETSGWQRGDMVVIAARPSMGKTAFLMNSLQHACARQRPDGRFYNVAMFSLEMTLAQLELRMLASISGVDAGRIRGGHIYENDWGKISQAVGTMSEWNLHIDDSGRRTPRDVRAECRRLRGEVGHLDLVAIDYFQLMSASVAQKGDNRTAELTRVSRDLKELAKELDVPLIVLSQLKRTGGSRPQLEDLRETGALEQDADIVAFLHRKGHKEDGLTYYDQAKGRNVGTAVLKLMFDKYTLTYTDAPDAVEEAPLPAAGEKTAEEKHADKVRAIIRGKSRKRRSE